MLALVFDNKWPGAAELILGMECPVLMLGREHPVPRPSTNCH